ncbi:MAG: hypothetical protein EA426_03725 [Spirochaetaceae bacterium]|nr:MAG: hypothetical protein EA426_03725 [Spirochaetaceae bacterium]
MSRWNSNNLGPRSFVALVFVVFLMSGSLFAQTNPFFGTGGQERDDGSAPKESTVDDDSVSTTRSPATGALGGRPFFPRINAFLRDQQRTLNERVGRLIRTVSSSGDAQSAGPRSATGVVAVVVVSFLYGLVHAALPGHRKVLLVSYFVAVRAPVRHAVIAGVSVAALHSGAAAALVLGVYYLLQTSLSFMLDRATVYLQAITAVIIAGTGAVLLTLKIREVIAARRGATAHHGHDAQSGGHERPSPGMLPAIVISAVVPCPGTAMILLFAVSLGAIGLGLLATFAFSLGMAVTLVGVSVIAVVSKRAVTGALDGRVGEVLHTTIEGVGAVAMCVFGVIAFMAVM